MITLLTIGGLMLRIADAESSPIRPRPPLNRGARRVTIDRDGFLIEDRSGGRARYGFEVLAGVGPAISLYFAGDAPQRIELQHDQSARRESTLDALAAFRGLHRPTRADVACQIQRRLGLWQLAVFTIMLALHALWQKFVHDDVIMWHAVVAIAFCTAIPSAACLQTVIDGWIRQRTTAGSCRKQRTRHKPDP